MARLSLRSRYSLILVAVSAAILGFGILFRPRQPETRPLSESEMSRLQQIAQERRLDDLGEYLSDAADRAAPVLLALNQPPWTAVVRYNRAVSSGIPRDSTIEAVDSRGNRMKLDPAPVPAGVPLQIFNVPPSVSRLSPHSTAANVTAGDWVLAVARNNDRQTIFAHGVFQSTGPARCHGVGFRQIYSSAPLSDALIGGGLFTMDGDLLGVIAECDGHPDVIDLQTVDELLRQPVPLNERLASAYGLGVSEARGGGVQVTAVWSGSSADRAGIRPSDLIAAADGRPVASVPDLARLADEPLSIDHSLELFRGRKPVRVALAARSASAGVDAPGGLTLDAGPGAADVVVREVATGSAGARSGLRPGDLLEAVDGRTVQTPEEAAKLLSKTSPAGITLAIRRDGRTGWILLMPGEAR